ncbi:hypothetical protein TWF694_004383 [Orbilia ellipsospora]|uniref:Uncharacterized protein n=1 Tax=Orbilia ellipsospora TaxID=2528407 RepID=A0AAV9WXY5_9PEZI
MATPPSPRKRAPSPPDAQLEQLKSPSPPHKRRKTLPSGYPHSVSVKTSFARPQKGKLVSQLPSPAPTSRSSESLSPGSVRSENQLSLQSQPPVSEFQNPESPFSQAQNLRSLIYQRQKSHSLSSRYANSVFGRFQPFGSESYIWDSNDDKQILSSWLLPSLSNIEFSVDAVENLTHVEDEEDDDLLTPPSETIASMIRERAAEDIALGCPSGPFTRSDFKFAKRGELEICQRVEGNLVMSERQKRRAFRQSISCCRPPRTEGEYKGRDYSNLFSSSCFSNPHVQS